MTYRVLDLFSGIGGFSLGLERTGGFETVAFCEIDPFARRVLAMHWPDVPIYEDVRDLTAERLAADGIAVDVICGGFPCQDISTAGRGAGIEGERSGLWSEIARLAGELRPELVIVENVAALLGRGLGRVLGDLAEIGFDAEWHCIPAAALGAPHRRDRFWLVAYPSDVRCEQSQYAREVLLQTSATRLEPCEADRLVRGCANVAHAESVGPRCRWGRSAAQSLYGSSLSYPEDDAEDGSRTRRGVSSRAWRSEPDVGRVAHGVPSRVDRLRCLGNAVVPQIPEMIGRAILLSEGRPA